MFKTMLNKRLKTDILLLGEEDLNPASSFLHPWSPLLIAIAAADFVLARKLLDKSSYVKQLEGELANEALIWTC